MKKNPNRDIFKEIKLNAELRKRGTKDVAISKVPKKTPPKKAGDSDG